ncbi:MAG: FG-GAP-like repeat-containing protein, partial [Bifidobacteriaceae bacterium]|nr:FG-GAP-like repeat-containing protein [Bifidobacteriaceae bacterium]
MNARPTSRQFIRLTVAALALAGLAAAPAAWADPAPPVEGDLAAGVTQAAAPAIAPQGVGGVATMAAITIDTSNKDAVERAYRQYYLGSMEYAIGWTGNAANCVAGTTSAAGQAALFDTINFFRAMAGLPSVTEDKTESARALKAALMLEANNTLTHYRSSLPKCNTPDGVMIFPPGYYGEIAAYSGRRLAAAWPEQYIWDGGASNRALGHRWQLLSGALTVVASGSTDYYNVMHTKFGGSVSLQYWSWPGKGYYPYPLYQVTGTDWTFYPGSGLTSVASATVSVVKIDSAGVTTAVAVSDIRTVDGGLGWVMPNNLAKPAAGKVDTYRVTVSGITGTPSSVTYDVKLFTPYEPTYSRFTLTPDLDGDKLGEIITLDRYGQLQRHEPKPGVTGLQSSAYILYGLSGHRLYGPGDWDRDGKADILTVDTSGNMWLLKGDGKGSIASKVQAGRGWSAFRIIPAGDLNGDKNNDLLAIDGDGKLWLYAGNGLGGFKPSRTQVGKGWSGFNCYAAGDLNKDGKADILGVSTAGLLYAYLGRGNGTFDAAKQVGKGWGVFSLAAGADLNGDGLADIVGRNDSTGQLYYYQSKGAGSFAAAKLIAT